MAHAKVLQAGSVSASARRTATLAIVALACAARAWVHFSSGQVLGAAPAPLLEFLGSGAWPWIEPPLPALVLALAAHFPRPDVSLLVLEMIATAVVVVALLRMGERWLDFDAAVIGSLLWAVCAPAVLASAELGLFTWPAAFSVLVARAAFRVAHRRAPELAWRIGISSGLLTLVGGAGLLWVVAALVWLPTASNRLRGRGALRASALLLAGWVVIVSPVAVRNAIVSGGDPKLPMAGSLARLHAATGQATVAAAPFSERLRANVIGPVSAAYADSVLRAQDLPVEASEWTRATNLLTLTLAEAGAHEGAGWRAGPRRLLAFVGGWTPTEHDGAPGVPWVWITVIAWSGVLALVPAARPLLPLLLGGAIPIVQAMVFGIDAAVLVAASPFVCLYAGYGIWRIWSGRHWALTWVLAPLALAPALLVHWIVRQWR